GVVHYHVELGVVVMKVATGDEVGLDTLDPAVGGDLVGVGDDPCALAADDLEERLAVPDDLHFGPLLLGREQGAAGQEAGDQGQAGARHGGTPSKSFKGRGPGADPPSRVIRSEKRRPYE